MKLYIKENCPNCITVKRMLDTKEIYYEEINIMKNDIYKYLFRNNIMSMPAAEIDGKLCDTDELLKFIRKS